MYNGHAKLQKVVMLCVCVCVYIRWVVWKVHIQVKCMYQKDNHYKSSMIFFKFFFSKEFTGYHLDSIQNQVHLLFSLFNFANVFKKIKIKMI